MSYDIYLKEPVTGEVAQVPGHLMIGGTYKADYHPEAGSFTPALNTDAHLNITYNYGHYYYESYNEKRIRVIYGISGVESIPMLDCTCENETGLYLGWRLRGYRRYFPQYPQMISEYTNLYRELYDDKKTS